MTREGRLGFPRPFGNILRQYRPLIPDVPVKVGKVASAIESGYGRKVDVTEVQGVYSIDFVMDIRGADEFSRSSLQFDSEADFIGGMIRAGTVSLGGVITAGEILDEWNNLLTEDVNLRMEEDDIDVIMRENNGNITPHVFFTTRNAGTSDKESPVQTNEILDIIEKIGDSWQDRFADYPMSGRSLSSSSSSTGNMTTEDEDVDDMMEFL